MKKKIAIIMALLLCMGCSVSCGKQSGNIVTSNATDLPDYEANKDDYKFLTSAYYSPSVTETAVKEYFDCGFDIMWINGGNIGYGSSAVTKTKAVLEYAQNLGKKCVIDASAGRMASSIDNSCIANDWGYQNYESLWGIDAFDEPICYKEGIDGRTSIDDLSTYIPRYEQIYGAEIPFFINLLPLSSSIIGTDYPTYIKSNVDNILKKLDPKMEKWISCDTYALIYDKAKDKYMLRDSWLGNLQIIADTKFEYSELDIKTNFFILSVPHTTGSTGYDRPIGYNELRIQLYTLLAFGYDMASFFCYATPQGVEGENYKDALIGADGNKTDTWTASQRIISELNEFSYVLKQFTYKGVYAVEGKVDNYSNNNFDYLEQLKSSKLGLLQSSEASADTLISCFKDVNDNDGYVVVNMNDPYYGCSDSVKMTFADSDHAIIYSSGKKNVVELKDGKLELELGVGEGVFVIPYVA